MAESEGQASGLVVGTKVATRVGWRAIETLAVGDDVLTFDSGFQPVTRIKRARLWGKPEECPENLLPLSVPVDALGNQTAMLLLPEQLVMIESDTAEEVLGDPFTLLPAAALLGFRGIERATPTEPVSVLLLGFEEDQVIFGNVGALFYCPQTECGEIRKNMLDLEDDGPYAALSLQQAESLAAIIETDEAREEVM